MGRISTTLGVTTVTMSPLLYQHVTDVMFETIIREYLALCTQSASEANEEVAFTYEERNAICYIGGYVVRELKKDKSNE